MKKLNLLALVFLIASLSTSAFGASGGPTGGGNSGGPTSIPVPISQGGTGTTSTLTGLVRGNAAAMTAAELSGDATTSGSNAVTVTKTNGTAFGPLATAPLNDINFRTSILENACANSGTASVTCSNAQVGDLLVVVGGDCTSTSTQTCPAGFTQNETSAGGTTLTVCTKIAVTGDAAVAQKITSTAHQVSMQCLDAFSTGGSTVSVAAVTIGACVANHVTTISTASVTAATPPYAELGIVDQQAQTMSVLNGIDLTNATTVAISAAWLPNAVISNVIAEPIYWIQNGGTNASCAALLIAG